MNNTSTHTVNPALVQVTEERARQQAAAATATLDGRTLVKLSNTEKQNLAHNLLVAKEISGLSMEAFRKSKGVVVSWTAMDTALKGTALGYQVKTLNSFCILSGLGLSQLTKLQSDRKPIEAGIRTPVTVEGYNRNQPTGPRNNPVVKPIKVSAHTKVPGVRGEALEAAKPTMTEPDVAPAAKAGSILFQIGSEVMYLPLANLKSVLCNEDGTLTFTVKP